MLNSIDAERALLETSILYCKHINDGNNGFRRIVQLQSAMCPLGQGIYKYLYILLAPPVGLWELSPQPRVAITQTRWLGCLTTPANTVRFGAAALE